jgi:hypothetical protein
MDEEGLEILGGSRVVVFQGNGVVVSSEVESQGDGGQIESRGKYYSLIVSKQGSQRAAGGVEEVGEIFRVVGEAENLKDQVLPFDLF